MGRSRHMISRIHRYDSAAGDHLCAMSGQHNQGDLHDNSLPRRRWPLRQRVSRAGRTSDDAATRTPGRPSSSPTATTRSTPSPPSGQSGCLDVEELFRSSSRGATLLAIASAVCLVVAILRRALLIAPWPTSDDIRYHDVRRRFSLNSTSLDQKLLFFGQLPPPRPLWMVVAKDEYPRHRTPLTSPRRRYSAARSVAITLGFVNIPRRSRYTYAKRPKLSRCHLYDHTVHQSSLPRRQWGVVLGRG